MPTVKAAALPVGELTKMPQELQQREAANSNRRAPRDSQHDAGHALLDWVPMSRYCEISGETPDAVDKRVRSGFWLRDVHVRHPAGSKQLWINLPAVNAWAAGAPLRTRRRA